MIEFYLGKNILLLIPKISIKTEWFRQNIEQIATTHKLSLLKFEPFDNYLL
jgi:hypothetical protein